MLLEINKISTPQPIFKGKRSKSSSGLKVFYPKGWKHLREHIGILEKDMYHHFVTDGYWSAIHLLEYLLEQCGTSKVWFTSWSISENAIRRMVTLKTSGMVISFTGLLDKRVKIYTTAAYHFAEQHMDITLLPIHAKVIVIRGENMQIVVNQSANLNDNKRVESGVISTLAEDVDFYIEWIENLKHGK